MQMLALKLLLVIGLLLVCSFAPGFFFLRNVRWRPLEKLCGSVGLSLLLLYLVFWAIYCLGPSGHEMPHRLLALVSAACLALGVASRRQMMSLFAALHVRQALIGFSFLLLWTLVLLAMIRNYSGAAWVVDWQEHFQRSLFFLHRFPTDTPIFQGYQLPARPPMMNVLGAFFLAQTADRYEIFQVVFTFLNLLMFLPCCLIVSELAGARRTSTAPLIALTALFALNPMVMQNVTYSWTKSLAAFYVVLALCFYLAAWRKNDSGRMIAAFIALSAGVLVHYSAGIYCLFLTLHYLLFLFWKRSRPWRELATIAAACGFLLATWFGWSVAVYGSHATLASNSSVTSSQEYAGSNFRKVAANEIDSVVPVFFRDHSPLQRFRQPTLAGTVRDDAFVFYQTNVIFAMGLIGGPLILWYLYRALFRRRRANALSVFWLAMILFCLVVGIASVGEKDPLGVAHLTLLPLEILGLSLLAAMFPLPRILLILVVAGCLIDFSLGVFLHAHIESLENTPQKTVFSGLRLAGNNAYLNEPTPYSLSQYAWTNWYHKHQYALTEDWLLELSRYRPGDDRFLQHSAAQRGELERSLNEDQVYWHGWYAGHNGTITLLGDDVAGESGLGTRIATFLLVALAFVVVIAMLNGRFIRKESS
jgi:4-amino-4-deoxy-L-arabinose transferase-like glycosyltransferase